MREDGRPDVEGVALLSAPFFFDRKPRRALTLRLYYGTDDLELVRPRSGVGLLESLAEQPELANANADPRLCPTLVTVGQYDAGEITDANLQFLAAYRARNKGALPAFSVRRVLPIS